MFSGFMVHAWEIGSIVAVVGGVVGFFVVLRGAAFEAHAIPNGAFAGAAGASLIGASTLLGLGVFAVGAAVSIAFLSRRGRPDVVTALALVMMLALGAAFLSQTTQYEPEIYSLLFGEVLGVSSGEILPVAALGLVALVAVGVLYRPLLLTSLVPEVAKAAGIRTFLIELVFLITVAVATTMTVPVVGALLIFSLMIGPPAAARCVTDRPSVALAGSVAIALVTIWTAIAAAYATDWPVGFFVGALSAGWFAIGRSYAVVSIRVRATDRSPRPTSSGTSGRSTSVPPRSS
jgi:zinc/manganese transport system permease protein